jgi:protein-S-isoprenylcysteine O-methyltransferase Ste14
VLLTKGADVPVVALVLFVVFAALGFGWRREQRRRTGSTGFRGISGRLGSAEWFAGVGFVAALAAAVLAPVLQLVGAVSPVAVLHAPLIQTAGIVIAVVGIFATVYAQLDMGDSWRIGVDPSETTTLVRTGVFGWVRNPIFTAMMTFGFGIALVTPNLVAIAGFLLLAATIELQVRIVEEPYLLTVHGDAYRDYLANVGRFVPGVGRGRLLGGAAFGWVSYARMR